MFTRLNLRRGTSSRRASVVDDPATTSGTAQAAANPIPNNHFSDTDYAARCKLLLELSAGLHKLDTDLNLKLDFPRLVVIGDQSSGKSSVVEAVSGISVPRDSGTCTRCPMECIMRSTTDSWSCQISIQTDFNEEGRRMTPFGNRIYDKSSVELWIRRAQAAVLSPYHSPTYFFTKTASELKNEDDPLRMQFSTKSVYVEIRDPDSPNLDFVDLPGIVHTDETLEHEVTDLAKSFIKPEKTLILIVMAMTGDWETQSAVQIAKGADPNGNRTIGILTKPDLLQDGAIGARERWMQIFTGDDPIRKTKHGYYCVRLPDDLQRRGDNTRAKAQETERDFFTTRSPWNLLPPRDKSRCGIPNFVKDISALLVELIEQYLPVLEKELTRLLDDCLKKIAKLPPVSDQDPSTEILLRISAFCQAFKDAVFGRQHRHFVQENRRRYSRFRQEISSTKPKYITSSGFMAIGTSPDLNLDGVRKVKEGTIAWELEPNVPFEATVQLVERYTSKWDKPSLNCFDDIVVNSVEFEKTLLKAHFENHTELLNFVRTLTSKERERAREEAQNTLGKILKFESQPLFTQNNTFFISERNKWLEQNVPGQWSDPDQAYYNRHHFSQNQQYYQEFELMASSHAYFQVAHQRLMDSVPLMIEHELNQTFVNNIQTLLFSSVTQQSKIPGRMEELIREDSALGRRRVKLETRRTELMNIKQKLDDFWSLSNGPPPTSHFAGPNARPSSPASTYHSTTDDVNDAASVATRMSIPIEDSFRTPLVDDLVTDVPAPRRKQKKG